MTLAKFDDNSNQPNVYALIDQWLEQESSGNQFPVPFDMAWQLAGYARKDNAKRKLESFMDKGLEYSSELRNIGVGKPIASSFASTLYNRARLVVYLAY